VLGFKDCLAAANVKSTHNDDPSSRLFLNEIDLICAAFGGEEAQKKSGINYQFGTVKAGD